MINLSESLPKKTKKEKRKITDMKLIYRTMQGPIGILYKPIENKSENEGKM